MSVGKDKHPPMKAERLKTSTNKKAKAKTSSSVGAPVKTASGSKRIKPGDGSKPATKTVGPYETLAMKAKKADDKIKNTTVARRKVTPKLPKGTSA